MNNEQNSILTEKKHRASSSTIHSMSGWKGTGFVDNRPETNIQTKLINNIQNRHEEKYSNINWGPSLLQTLVYTQGDDPYTEPRLRHHLPYKTQSVTQYKLENTSFDTDEDIAHDNDSNYINDYCAIKFLVDSYNSHDQEENYPVIKCLRILDNLECKIRDCIKKMEGNDSVDIIRRKRQLESIPIERERIWLTERRTKVNEILAGPDVLIEEGKIWEIEDEGSWKASSIVLGKEKIESISISGKEESYMILDIKTTAGIRKGRAMIDQLALKAKFTNDGSKLYPHDIPVVEDVMQTDLGDCYLQAALASLASQDPIYIMEQLIYEMKDHIIVRLFDKSNKANFIKVERSIPQTTEGKNLYNNGALWVKMVQKAYASSGLVYHLFDFNQKGSISMKDIEGGVSSYVMRLLTGREWEEIKNDNPDGEQNYPWGEECFNALDYFDLSTEEEEEKKDESDYKFDLLNEIFNKDKIQIQEWAEFVCDHDITPIRSFKQIQDFDIYFSQKTNLSPEVKGKIMNWVTSSGLFYGKCGSGIYAKWQIEMFYHVDKALRAKKLVTVGSKREPPAANSSGTGQSGELTYKGLGFPHAYTILDVRANKTKDPENEQTGNIYWIKLRNPWGFYGRSYDANWEPIEINKGIFWVELSDISKNFDDIDIA